jgi:hypothetical protein
MKIDKGIPTPEYIHGGGRRKNKYPFEKMEVGDSFFCKCKKEDAQKTQATLKNSSQRLPEMRFTTKFVVERGRGSGVRIWRVK